MGGIAVGRRYCTGPACGRGAFGADRVPGLDGYLTAAARRMACLAGARQSFARAEAARAELAGGERDGETIRRPGPAEAARATATRDNRATAAALAAAAGDRAVHIGAGKVNTPAGRRDVKVAVCACRGRGAPADAASWDRRDRPAPAVRSAVASVEEASLCGARCAAGARRLGPTAPSVLSVGGGGAEWIGNLCARHFPGASEVRDVHPGAEQVAAAARRVFGAGTAPAPAAAPGRTRLVGEGDGGVVEWAGRPGAELPVGGDGAALAEALNYAAPHPGRWNDARRLRRGRSIGSGMIEGAIRHRVNRRLKQTGARWEVEHGGPWVELGASANSPEWNAYWNNGPQNLKGHPVADDAAGACRN